MLPFAFDSFCLEIDLGIIWPSSDDNFLANDVLVSLSSFSNFEFMLSSSTESVADAGTKFPYLQNGSFVGWTLLWSSFPTLRFGPRKQLC